MHQNPNSKLNLNNISEEKLVKVLAISARLAKRIIAFRPITSFSQLDQIWGLDVATKHKLAELFEFSSEKNDQPSRMGDETQEIELVSSQIDPSNLHEDKTIELKQEIEPATSQIEQITLHEDIPIEQEQLIHTTKARPSWKTISLLFIILLVGAIFRFSGLNWDDNFHQHPDERYLSMTAESINGAGGIGTYFDTMVSELNPLKHGSYTYGMLPLFITRMVAEWLDMTHYDSITLVGRALSGVFDLAAFIALFLLATRLYNKKIAFLAASLYALAVFPIQMSHFFTVDSFATVFVLTAFYFLLLAIPLDQPDLKITTSNYKYFGLFGFTVGMAGACKVNTLPVLGLVFVAGLIYILLNRKQSRIWQLMKTIGIGLFLTVLLAFIAFRVFQPYAFNGPGFSNIGLNQNWVTVMKEVTNQVAGNSEWPPNHHWTNRPIQYAWLNMVLWGMGLPLGLMAWFGWGWAGYRIWKGEWRKHLFSFVWILAYFVWQNMQFWRYMRYFLPIYPFLILFAAWALHEIAIKTKPQLLRICDIGKDVRLQITEMKKNWQGWISILIVVTVVVGTFAYAFAFTRVYSRPHTRVEASRWILANIPGPLNVIVSSDDEIRSYPIPVYNNQILIPNEMNMMDLKLQVDGNVSKITFPNIQQPQGRLRILLSIDETGEDLLVDEWVTIPDMTIQESLFFEFPEIELIPNKSYYLSFSLEKATNIDFSQMKLFNGNGNDRFVILDGGSIETESDFETSSTAFIVDQNIWINRLELMNVLQDFQPSNAVIRVSILQDRDESNPLVEAEGTVQFTKPGAHYSMEITFPEIALETAHSYQVKYELVEGEAVSVKAEMFALETSWDDALPLAVDDTDALGGIYKPLNLELYEPDTPEKRDRMIDILDASEYLVIPSNRAYDAMPRLELRYPLTLRYYQLLFDCECSSDALEKQAYKLKPPFKSPLGFDLIAVFVSNPNIGPLEINDQNADESFTVYDHPKVFVFKKSEDFSIEKIRQEFDRIDLDAVIFQVPKDYSRSNTALQLPPDRLEAQKNGGTWSQMFNHSSLLNVNQAWGVIAWYLLLLLIGLIVFPVVFRVFRVFPDKGYFLIRMAGLLLLAWLPWFFASIKWVPFTRWAILAGLLILLLLNGILFVRNKQQIVNYFNHMWQHVFIIEFIFLILFVFSLLVRMNNPDLWHPWLGGEKPMDFAFFNAVLKSVYFPPPNPWFSNHYINYYYYGFVVAAIPTKLLGILPSIAYNLVLPSWFAMTGIGVFGIGYNLKEAFRKRKQDPIRIENEETITFKNRVLKNFSFKTSAYLSGMIAIVTILFMGNFYQVKMLWKYLPEASILNMNAGNFHHLDLVLSGASQVISGKADLPGDAGKWYFSASRPILHDGPDTPIVEFPYFSFLYADMHPHLLTMPFFTLGLAWCLSAYLSPVHKRKWKDQLFALVLFGVFVGSFLASHTWDFPVMVALAMFIILWQIVKTNQKTLKQKIIQFLIVSIGSVGLAMLLYFPFSYWFKTEYSSIEFWRGAKTPLSDYFVVFGFPLFVMISLAFKFIFPELKRWYFCWLEKLGRKIYLVIAGFLALLITLWGFHYQVLALGLPFLLIWIYLIFFRKDISEIQRIAFFLFAFGFSLTFLTEVFVLKGDVGRSNMVFRIYLQAWFLLGIAISLGLIEMFQIIRVWRSGLRIGWIIVLQVLILFGLSYPLTATKYKIKDRWPNVENPPITLDGALFMLGDSLYNPELPPAYYSDDDRKLNLGKDYDGIRYMQDHVTGTPVIVEGYTTEYRWGGRYSIHTGLSAVIGWSWHTRQHNSLLDGRIVENRIEEVNNFYNGEDIESANEFLKRYEVGYIVVSDLERIYYSPQGLEKFNEMTRLGDLQIVYGDLSDDSAIIYEVLKGEK